MADKEYLIQINVQSEELVSAKKEVIGLENEIKTLKETTKGNTEEQKKNASALIALENNLDKAKKQYKELNNVQKANKGSLEELRMQTNKLTRERDSLGDITGKNATQFKNLTEKINKNNASLKEYDAQMGSHKRNVGNYPDILGKIQGGFLAISGAIAIGAGAFTAFISGMTKIGQVGDEFSVIMEKAKAVTSTFFNTIYNGDWSNFFDNANRAAEAAERYSRAIDLADDSERGFNIRKAQSGAELVKLNNQLRMTNLTNEQRLAVAEKIIAKEDELAQQERKIAKDRFDATVKFAAEQKGLSEKALFNYFKNYEVYNANMEKSIGGVRAKLEILRQSGLKSEEEITEILTKVYGKFAVVAAKFWSAAESIDDDTRKKIEETAVALANIDTELARSTSRAERVQAKLGEAEEKVIVKQAETKKQVEETKSAYELLFVEMNKLTDELNNQLTIDKKHDPVTVEKIKNLERQILLIEEQRKSLLSLKEVQTKQAPDTSLDNLSFDDSETILPWEEAMNKDIEAKRKANDQKNLLDEEYTDAAMQLTNSLFDYQMSKNELKMQEELKLAGDNEEKRQQIIIEYKKKEQDMAVSQALINGALAITNIWANTQPWWLALILSAASAVTTATQINQIKAQNFATGGVVGDANIQTQPNGDNVLATVKTGEVVLTEEQQAALGGRYTFKKIGVPGFASGGIVGSPSMVTSSAVSDNQQQIMSENISQSINEIQVVQDLSGLEKAQKFYVKQKQTATW